MLDKDNRQFPGNANNDADYFGFGKAVRPTSAEGLPSYFSNVYLLESNVPTKLRSGLVETGNIIEAK